MRHPFRKQPVRRLGFALALALALLLGGQAALLHELGHATAQIASKGGKPLPTTCDQCFLFAPFAGAIGSSPPQVPVVAIDTFIRAEEAAAGFLAAPRLAFRSRAPPALS